jgi:hypothetical protein
MIGELAGGVEIFVERGRTQEKHVARVRESLPSPAVGLEFLREPVITPSEVADRAIVFRVGEAAHRHRPGITRVCLGESVEGSRDPAGDGRLLISLERFRLRRRHLAALDRVEDAVPEFELLVEFRIRGEGLQVDLALGFFTAVAAVAFGREHRLDRFPLGRGGGDHGKTRGKSQEREDEGTNHGGGHEGDDTSCFLSGSRSGKTIPFPNREPGVMA